MGINHGVIVYTHLGSCLTTNMLVGATPEAHLSKGRSTARGSKKHAQFEHVFLKDVVTSKQYSFLAWRGVDRTRQAGRAGGGLVPSDSISLYSTSPYVTKGSTL